MGDDSPERKCWDTESRFAGNTCGTEGWLEKFGQSCFSSGPKILTATPLLLRHPAGLLTRRWLVSHVHFISYSSAGTFDLFPARDYFFLKTNFPRTDRDVEGRWTRGPGEWKIRSLSFSFSLWRQPWFALSLWNLVIVQANNGKKDPRLTKSRLNLATSNCV